MTTWKSVLLAAVAGALVTFGTLAFVQRSRAREASALRAANQRLRFDAHQRIRLASSARPAPSAAEPVPAGVASPPTATAPAPVAPPVEDYRDEGRATPLATLQTFAWACDRGDVEQVLRMIRFDDAARPKAVAFLAAQPAETRARWATPEAMAAALLTSQIMHHPFPRASILAQAETEPAGADRVTLRLRGTPKDGMVFQRTAEGWSYAITEEAVDRYLARAQAAPPP